ncbi:MAG: diguanylate cyclase response regulator [Alphaproteobacteria bacterium CG_4_10_14_0_2_um_filter_63_37]|nr:MAG: hypothetical protein AUJ55_04210 [Proteobacteria bacterium CG1_02_64_396]PJA24148.1 MAG: diguanylate cyclase response regulator [Alphaproteobacteria bacterium CG_4_10_14_0_2_um_filter_63_37]
MESVNKPHVVLVEDDLLSATVVSQILGRFCRVEHLRSGEVFLASLRAPDLPDLVLLDVNLPGVDGYQICQTLKDDDATRHIPVIFISSNTSTEDEERGLSLGAVDYIKKPFSPGIVRARVRTHLDLKRQRDLLEKMAFIDGLTGIPNRRRFDEALHREWYRCECKNRPLSLLFVDVDFFKHYNDFYGHFLGDKCLRSVAVMLEQYVVRSPADSVARYGGEEFAVLLPETNFETAMQIAEQGRRQIETVQIEHRDSRVGPWLTVSIGVGCLVPQESLRPNDLVQLADSMMYEAKEGGRNRVRGEHGKIERPLATRA